MNKFLTLISNYKKRKKIKNIVEIVQGQLLAKNHTLLYLSEFGSSLYGLNSKSSDMDIIGIFLPNLDNLILYPYCENEQHITISSKTNDTKKNTENDYDIKLFSLQYFLQKLRKTEVESCDILFSYTNKKTILYDSGFNKIFKKYKDLINLENETSFIGYGINQVKKYGLRGTSVGIAQKILDAIDAGLESGVIKLTGTLESAVLTVLIDIINDPENVKIFNVVELPIGQYHNDVPVLKKALSSFNSIHFFDITIKEFRNRIQGFYDKYGERAKLASQNNGIDWKAASHGLRSLINYYSLITTGYYTYPFTGDTQKLLYDIKYGKITWESYEKIFMFWKEKIDTSEKVLSPCNPTIATNIILEYYTRI